MLGYRHNGQKGSIYERNHKKGWALFEEDEYGFMFLPEWLKKVEEPKKSKSAKCDLKIGDLKIGDKIKLLDGSNIKGFAYKWVDFMSKDVGRICTVSEIVNYLDVSGVKVKGVKVKEDTKWKVWDTRAIKKV